MNTIFDWMTIGLFGFLVILYLQRSSLEEPVDRVWHYVPPALACALANYFGNHGQSYLAVGLMVAVAAYVYYVLKPGRGR